MTTDPALIPFVGTWHGQGEGHYPTIEPFAYVEALELAAVPGKPFLRWSQRTRRASTGEPLHAEVGFLRTAGDGRAELMLAHPFGIAEVEEGMLADGVLDVRTTTLGISSTARAVRALRRRYVVDGDALAYDLWMAFGDHDDEHHLAARLVRETPPRDGS